MLPSTHTHLVCFGHVCMKDDNFVSAALMIGAGILFALPILLALSDKIR